MRLIDANAFKDYIDCGHLRPPTKVCFSELDVCNMIDKRPTIDAVQVVRCKDCLMTKERDEYTGKVWCCRHREYMDDMYYCADGLRREDGEADETD